MRDILTIADVQYDCRVIKLFKSYKVVELCTLFKRICQYIIEICLIRLFSLNSCKNYKDIIKILLCDFSFHCTLQTVSFQCITFLAVRWVKPASMPSPDSHIALAISLLHKQYIRTHSSSPLAANNIELPLSTLPSHLCSSSLDVCALHSLRKVNLTVFMVQ